MKKYDPATYRAMSAPHDTQAAAQEAVSAFFDAVEAARKEFRIKEVVVLVQCNVMMTPEQEGCVGASAHYGDPFNKLPILAQAYGAEKAAFDTVLAAAIRGK